MVMFGPILLPYMVMFDPVLFSYIAMVKMFESVLLSYSYGEDMCLNHFVVM